MNAVRLAYPLFLISLVLFGTNGVIADGISLPSHHIVLLRTLLGAALLMSVYLLMGRRYHLSRNPRQTTFLILSGVSMGVSWIFLYMAYEMVGVGVASLEYYCGPVIVMALSPVVFHERLNHLNVVGFSVVVVGAFLLCDNPDMGGTQLTGHVYGFISAAAHAAMVIFSKKADAFEGLENSSMQILCSFLVVLVYCVVISDLPDLQHVTDWGNIVFLGFVNTGLGCLLYFSTIIHLRVRTVSIAGYLEPLSALVFSVLLLGEAFSLLQLIGAAAVIAGAMVSEILGNDKRPNGSGA